VITYVFHINKICIKVADVLDRFNDPLLIAQLELEQHLELD